jgi:hypothetical protein
VNADRAQVVACKANCDGDQHERIETNKQPETVGYIVVHRFIASSLHRHRILTAVVHPAHHEEHHHRASQEEEKRKHTCDGAGVTAHEKVGDRRGCGDGEGR